MRTSAGEGISAGKLYRRGEPITVAATMSSMRADNAPAGPTGWTFSLVDLAGFTALTEAHGDDQAADLAVSFTDLARSRLAAGDRMVKPIGDAVLLASPTPEAALVLVRGLLRDCQWLPNFPVVRAGMHHGLAAERNGDFFGAAVNLTARVAGQAQGDQVLATPEVAEAARGLGIDVHSTGTMRLRNVTQPQELFCLEMLPHVAAVAVDPVCRMRIDRATAGAMIRRDGQQFWFCSQRCLNTYLGSVQSY